MTCGGRMPIHGAGVACALGLLLIVSAALAGAGMTGTWTVLQPFEGYEPYAPLPRTGHIMVADPARDRLVLNGGTKYEGIDPEVTLDTPVFSLTDRSWTDFWTLRGPWSRNGHSVVPTANPGEFVVFGGGVIYGSETTYNDTWRLSLAATPQWTGLTPAGPAPPARVQHVAVYDSARNRMVVWGGYAERTVFALPVLAPNDVWVLSLDPGGTWTRLEAEGEMPASRANAAAVYDPVRDRMLLIGGSERLGETSDGTWALDFSPRPRWERLEISGPPPAAWPGFDSTPYQWTRPWAFYDAENDLVVVYDGWQRIWVLFPEGKMEWVELETAGDPPEYSNSAAYDPSSRTLYASAYGLWSLSLSDPEMVQVRIRPGSPEPRVPARLQGALPVAILSTASLDARDIDPATIRLAGAPVLSHGKAGFQVHTQDVDHDGRADLVVNVDGGALEYGEPGTSLFLDAGTSDGRPVWGRARYESVPPARTLDNPATRTPTADPALNLPLAVKRAVPLASRRGAEVAIHSDAPGPVRVALFDVQGRMLGTAELPEGPPGTRSARVETPARLASGVYFVRVQQGDRSAARRLIVF